MEELLKSQHEDNIEGINRIIKSINSYFQYMQEKHQWRDESNSSQAMNEWRKKFIECKENMSNAFSQIAAIFTSVKYTQMQSDKLYKEFVEDLKSLPDISRNTTTNYNPRWDNSLISSSSNINIVEIWKMRYKTQTEDIPKLLEEIVTSFQKYNYWLAELEMNQTQNYKAMGWFEKNIKSILQDNEEARSLRKHILDYQFNNLPLSISTSDGIKQIEYE